ncbi:MAG TPA: OmpH family outer membrane protein [bacterium]|nr:OmpH family outer membrane protein [bacterium]
MTRRLLVTLGLAVLVGGCAPRLGVVDTQRLLNETVAGLSFQKQLSDREKAMEADLQLLSSQLSQNDLAVRRQMHVRELATLRLELEGRLNDRIRKATAEVARQRRLRIVLVKGPTLMGGVDVTDAVMERLK